MSLLRGRERAGIDAHVLFLSDGPLRAQVEAEGMPATVIDPGRFREPWRLGRAIGLTARLLRAERPDLCISWLPRVQTVLAPAAAMAGMRRKVVYFEHELTRGGVLNRLAVMLPCAGVIANSHATLEATRAMWPHRDGRVVWPGIAPPERMPSDDLAALREQLGLPNGRPVIGIVGRLVDWKGHDRLIEACARLVARGRDVSLLIVGAEAHGVDPGREDHLRGLVRRRGLEDRVVFTGHVDSAAPYIDLLDVLVSASDGEPFGLVLLEAMALGKAVVAVGRAGPTDIVEHGRTGLLVPEGTPDELADAIAALLDEPERRAACGQAGAARYAAYFGEERMLDEVREALRSLWTGQIA